MGHIAHTYFCRSIWNKQYKIGQESVYYKVAGWRLFTVLGSIVVFLAIVSGDEGIGSEWTKESQWPALLPTPTEQNTDIIRWMQKLPLGLARSLSYSYTFLSLSPNFHYYVALNIITCWYDRTYIGQLWPVMGTSVLLPGLTKRWSLEMIVVWPLLTVHW